MPKIVMVLNDGETYSDLKGCYIVALDVDTIDKWNLDRNEVIEYLTRDVQTIGAKDVAGIHVRLNISDLAEVIGRFD